MKHTRKLIYLLITTGVVFIAFATPAFGAETDEGTSNGVQHFGIVFAMFALVLIAGKLGSVVERFGQPAVIGELLAGITLSGLGFLGWSFIGETLDTSIIYFLASFGALLLLFSIGLESEIHEMKKVGPNALVVALIGVVVPFTIGVYLIGPIFFGSESMNAKLFIGAALVATSVGITASVFRSLKIIRTRAAQTVLGAAIIDDILGLIILSVVAALATGGTVTALSVGFIFLKSFGFMIAAIVVGSMFAKVISKLLCKINTGNGMKMALAVCFALFFGYLAEAVGLEPIIGAFAAGLLLDKVHFKAFDDPEIVIDLTKVEYDTPQDKKSVDSLVDKHRETHVEDLVNTLGLIFIPIFFVYTGMQIDFASLLQPRLYVIAAIIAAFAILGKLVAGVAAKGTREEKFLVGMSMVPRGEVGLIFAATGKALGVLNDEVFSIIVLVVIITTFIAPPMIKRLAVALKRRQDIEEKRRFRSEQRVARLKIQDLDPNDLRNSVN